MQDSKIDVTIGPYETYEDTLFGYKVLFFNLFYDRRLTFTRQPLPSYPGQAIRFDLAMV